VTRSDIEDDTGFTVRHLVPIELAFTCGADYPSHGPPRFQLSCCWLGRSRRELLQSKLLEIAKDSDGDPVLFQWYQVLQDEALAIVGVVPQEEGGPPVLSLGGPAAAAAQRWTMCAVAAADGHGAVETGAGSDAPATVGSPSAAAAALPAEGVMLSGGADAKIEDDEPRRTVSSSYAGGT
jgi:hypothetical protein